MLNRNVELPLDLIYEFQNLIKVMAGRKDLEQDISQVMGLLDSDLSEMEVGYNNLKKVFTAAIVMKKKTEPKEPVSPVMRIDSFIEQFDPKAVMSKTGIAKLTGTSEAWVHNHKKDFVQSSKGINVVSFLKWLQIYNSGYFNTFKENFSR